MDQKIREFIYKSFKKRNPNWSDLKIRYESELFLKSSIYKNKQPFEVNEKKYKEFLKILKKDF